MSKGKVWFLALVAALGGLGTGNAAPRGYKFLDYIESTGKQRVNIGLNVNHSWATEYDFHFGHLASEKDAWLFGQYTWYRFSIDSQSRFCFANGVVMSAKYLPAVEFATQKGTIVNTVTGVAGLDPTYGTYEGIPAGATFPCFALAAISDETTQSGCTGWILYTNATDNAEAWGSYIVGNEHTNKRRRVGMF